MRTRDAIADEQLALRLALESGNGACPMSPLSNYRQGWKDSKLVLHSGGATPAETDRNIAEGERDYQVGSLARRIWESLPYAQRWWMYGETEAEMRRNRRRR